MRFNLGCGFNKCDGVVNVDRFADCAPDEVVDLENLLAHGRTTRRTKPT